MVKTKNRDDSLYIMLENEFIMISIFLVNDLTIMYSSGIRVGFLPRRYVAAISLVPDGDMKKNIEEQRSVH